METTAKERREKVFAAYNRHKDYAEDYIKNGIETNRKGFGRISVKGRIRSCDPRRPERYADGSLRALRTYILRKELFS